MFEKEAEEKAEEYANKNVPIDTFGFRSLDDVHYDVKQAFLAGLEYNNKQIAELKKELNSMMVSKNQQLTKAKQIIKDYMIIAKGSHTTLCGVPEENRTIYVLKLNEKAEEFLNSEVEKLIESPVDHIIEQNEKEVSLNPDYFSGGW